MPSSELEAVANLLAGERAPRQDLENFRRRLLEVARRRGLENATVRLERAAETAREPQSV